MRFRFDKQPSHCSPIFTAPTASQVMGVPRYENLNPGQQRMNVGNRLRAMLRVGTITTFKAKKRRSRKTADA